MADSGQYHNLSPPDMDGPEPDWKKVDWKSLIKRLLLYAKGRLEKIKWRGQYGGSVPKGVEPRDLVHDAIRKTVDGVRKWNPDKATLFKHLCGVISSDVSNLATCHENTHTRRASSGQQGDSDHKGEVLDLDGYRHPSPSPQDTAEWDSELEHLLEFMRKRDETLYRLTRLILVDGCRGTQELRDGLGVSGNDLNNIKKRLRRALKEYRRAHS